MSFGHCLGSGLALPCQLSLSSVIWGAGLSRSPTSSAPSGAAGVRTQPLQAREGRGTSCQGSQGLGSTRRGCICSPSSVGPPGVPAPPPSCWEDGPLALLLSGAPGLPWVREARTGTSCPTHQFPQKKEESGKWQRRKVGEKTENLKKINKGNTRGNPCELRSWSHGACKPRFWGLHPGVGVGPHPEAWAPWLPAVTAGCLGYLRLVKHQKRQNKNWEGVIKSKGDEKKIRIVSEPPPS